MSSCPSCAFPNAAVPAPFGAARSETCAFCGCELLVTVPVLGRWSKAEHGYSFATSNNVLLTASADGDLWRLTTAGGHCFTLVAVHLPGGLELVILDSDLNGVASLVPSRTSRFPSALIRNAEDRPVAVVRADGCGGFHGVAPSGDVVFFAGKSIDDSKAVDVLITDTGAELPLVTVAGMVLALETHNLSPTHPDLSRSPEI